MKKLIFKSLVTTCVAGVAIFLTPKASVAMVNMSLSAQVNMSLLTEVASSCQRDVFSTEYYQQLGDNSEFNLDDYSEDRIDRNFRGCIESRYFYSLVLSKFPWLASTEEMLPGYPSFAAVSLIADYNYGYSGGFNSGIIDCLVSQDENSDECSQSYNLKGLYSGDIDYSNKFDEVNYGNLYNYLYVCPSCYVTYNNYPSGRKMVSAFMEWFMKLEPSHRKELVSILGDEGTASMNRAKMNQEADRAWSEYEEIRERIAEEEKEQRRRELFE